MNYPCADNCVERTIDRSARIKYGTQLSSPMQNSQLKKRKRQRNKIIKQFENEFDFSWYVQIFIV